MYFRVLGRNLKNTFMKHQDIMAKDTRISVQDVAKVGPSLDNTTLVSMNMVGQSRTVREYDNLVTRITLGYDTVDDCYRGVSSCCHVKEVRVPLLCLNALDDPIAVAECIPYDEIRYAWP